MEQLGSFISRPLIKLGKTPTVVKFHKITQYKLKFNKKSSANPTNFMLLINDAKFSSSCVIL